MTVRRLIYTSSPPNDRLPSNMKNRPKSVILLMPNKGHGLALSLNELAVSHVQKGIVTQRAG
jgi:hypothetical protein